MPELKALLLFLLLLCANRSAGQGLRKDPKAVQGASQVFVKLQAVYSKSASWKSSFKQKPKDVCKQGGGSLCAPSGQLSPEESVQLLLTTSPAAYDARDPSHTGGFVAVSTVRDQGVCFACAGFAVIAAAESAIASTLKQDATNIRLSEQDLQFCKSNTPGIERTCTAPWSINEAVEALVRSTQPGRANKPVVAAKCLPYAANAPPDQVCNKVCSDVDPIMGSGQFSARQLVYSWDVQQHIRQYGAVVTRIDLFDDFRDFFAKSPKGIYQGPKPGAQLMENHAITLIGYDANQENWLAKNSWGEGFADKGFFRVHFNSSGKLGMCNPAETFGLVFKPEKRLQSPLGLKPAPGRSGCFLYTAQPADYISKVAVLFGMQVHQLLLDNEDTVSDLDAPIEGKTLVVCNASALLPPTATAATNSAPPTTVSGALTTSTGRTITQAEALLSFKSFVDESNANALFSNWQEGSDYCKWKGVECNGTAVTGLSLFSVNLTGTLPPGEVLQGLPSLVFLDLGSNQLRSTLPAEWGTRTRLQYLHVDNNQLSGTVPRDWGSMMVLQTVGLSNNALMGGCLPLAWQDAVWYACDTCPEDGERDVAKGVQGTLITGYCPPPPPPPPPPPAPAPSTTDSSSDTGATTFVYVTEEQVVYQPEPIVIERPRWWTRVIWKHDKDDNDDRDDQDNDPVRPKPKPNPVGPQKPDTPKPPRTPRPGKDTDKPRGTQKPDTPKPPRTPRPGKDTDKPGGTPPPGIPGKTPAPGNTPAAGSTPAPGTAPAPGSTPAPGTAPAPGTTPAPGTAPAPGTTPAPGTAAAPGKIVAQGSTAAPGTTQPSGTMNPRDDRRGSSQEPPSTSTSSGNTQQPATTTTPATTQSSDTADTPKRSRPPVTDSTGGATKPPQSSSETESTTDSNQQPKTSTDTRDTASAPPSSPSDSPSGTRRPRPGPSDGDQSTTPSTTSGDSTSTPGSTTGDSSSSADAPPPTRRSRREGPPDSSMSGETPSSSETRPTQDQQPEAPSPDSSTPSRRDRSDRSDRNDRGDREDRDSSSTTTTTTVYAPPPVDTSSGSNSGSTSDSMPDRSSSGRDRDNDSGRDRDRGSDSGRGRDRGR